MAWVLLATSLVVEVWLRPAKVQNEMQAILQIGMLLMRRHKSS